MEVTIHEIKSDGYQCPKCQSKNITLIVMDTYPPISPFVCLDCKKLFVLKKRSEKSNSSFKPLTSHDHDLRPIM